MIKKINIYSNFLILVSWFAIIAVSTANAEDFTQIKVLKMPVKHTVAVRSLLNETTKGTKPETMDAVLKLPGLSVMAEFKQANPWDGVTKELKKPMGKIEIGGNEVSELGVNLSLQGSKRDKAVDELLRLKMELPLGGKKYHSMQNFGSQMTVTPGRWQERACWGNAEEAWMLWQYSLIEDPKLGMAQPKTNPRPPMFVEMCWFQASASDLKTLGQAKPETREKALQWLATRAKRCRECSFWMMPNSKSGWGESVGKFELQDKEPVAEEDRFSIEGGFTTQGNQMKMAWQMETSRKGKDVTRNLASAVTPGVWEFIIIEGMPETNVLACRLSFD